jgi:hypothetical protein
MWMEKTLQSLAVTGPSAMIDIIGLISEPNVPNRRLHEIFSFVKCKLLGRGDVGKVFLVRQKATDKLFAMKGN